MANRGKTVNTQIGRSIKAHREATGITQKQLAQKLYKSESTVRMWELGKSEPDIETLKIIASFFGTTTDSLLGIQYEKSPDIIMPKDFRKIIDREMGTASFSVSDLSPEKQKLFEEVCEYFLKALKNL